MTHILKALAIAAILVGGAVASTSSAVAAADSPFYPDQFKSPTLPLPSVGADSGIPRAYRLGD